MAYIWTSDICGHMCRIFGLVMVYVSYCCVYLDLQLYNWICVSYIWTCNGNVTFVLLASLLCWNAQSICKDLRNI